jgi:hypothetical protein
MRRQILKSLLVDAAVPIGTELHTQQPAPPEETGPDSLVHSSSAPPASAYTFQP